ncbi:putative nucleotide-diphospho-sugar transferase [Martelella sp. HB161492]|uniref:putative nucleotide-diphospho-sugar transferase n=1 Tax=Martelella sp. HB161492 TaxID=2720726 RepID=UPI001590DE97|nr:putative nucleotide-diphospho-sugar transferase [Martelella sp. HB161492]
MTDEGNAGAPASRRSVCGVIYVATGDQYRDLARQSAITMKAHNPGLPVDLFTDDVACADRQTFDAVHEVPINHDRAKLECFPLSRFDKTLYLDCDTLVLRPFGDLFNLADRFDLSLAHDVRRRSALVQQGLEQETPYAFPQLNSGVMVYRKSAVMLAFFAEWARRYHATPEIGRDQVFLKDMLWSSDLRFYVLPPEFNLRRVTVLDAWEPLDAAATIIHSHRLLDHIRKTGAARISTIADILSAERIALLDEWQDAHATKKRPRPEDIGTWALSGNDQD